MNRMDKKCLIASASTHAFLAGLVLVGSAFIIPRENPPPVNQIQFVPEVFIKEALAGGGGNPNLPRTDAIQKGETLLPPAPAPAPPEPTAKQETKAAPPPAPAPEKTEPPKPKVEKKTVVPVEKIEKKSVKEKPIKDNATKAAKVLEPKQTSKDSKDAPLDLKPVVRPNDQKRKAEEKARATEEKSRLEAEARQAREAARQWARTNEKLSDVFAKAADRLQRGFASGTQVDVGGPGGPAYANYASLVQAVYDDAWELIRDLSNDDFVTKVSITVSREGNVLTARVIKRSGNPAMDKSVQKSLDKVRFVAPFPEHIKEPEKTFIINFNLQAKRLIG
jgi:TonB family protein